MQYAWTVIDTRCGNLLPAVPPFSQPHIAFQMPNMNFIPADLYEMFNALSMRRESGARFIDSISSLNELNQNELR